MIITCEKCETRFRLQEERIPKKGTQVRCSRCATSFFVPHPSQSAAQAAPLQASSAPTPPSVESQAPTSPAAAPAPDLLTPQNASAEEENPFGESSAELSLDPHQESETNPDLGLDGELNDENQSGETQRSDQYSAEIDAMTTGAQMNLEVESKPDEEEIEEEIEEGIEEEIEEEKPDEEMDWEFDQPLPTMESKNTASEDDFDERDGLFGSPIDDRDFGSEVGCAAQEKPIEPVVVLPSEDHAAAAAEDIEDLGSPEDWDLLGRQREEPVGENTGRVENLSPSTIGFDDLDMTHAAPPLHSETPVPEASVETMFDAEEQESAVDEFDAKPNFRRFSIPSNSASLLRMAGHALGWVVTAVVFAGVAYASLLPTPRALEGMPSSVSVLGYTVKALKAELIENRWGGTLLVVSGQLKSSDPLQDGEFPHLSVSLSGAEAELARVPLAPAVSERALREQSVGMLREMQNALARRTVFQRSGGSLRFHAIFDDVPAAATSFDVIVLRSID